MGEIDDIGNYSMYQMLSDYDFNDISNYSMYQMLSDYDFSHINGDEWSIFFDKMAQIRYVTQNKPSLNHSNGIPLVWGDEV
jgi:hypothetical protein